MAYVTIARALPRAHALPVGPVIIVMNVPPVIMVRAVISYAPFVHMVYATMGYRGVVHAYATPVGPVKLVMTVPPDILVGTVNPASVVGVKRAMTG